MYSNSVLNFIEISVVPTDFTKMHMVEITEIRHGVAIKFPNN